MKSFKLNVKYEENEKVLMISDEKNKKGSKNITQIDEIVFFVDDFLFENGYQDAEFEDLEYLYGE